MQPPDFAIEHAVGVAKNSPCAKTRRGAVVFHDGRLLGAGWNHPPRPLKCDGSEACRKDCGRRCVHAEVQAVRHAWHEFALEYGTELVHVKIDSDGKLEAGGGPSCWQCSREILDAGIAAVWLYERVAPMPGPDIYNISTERCEIWHRYTAEEFHRVTCANAKGGTIYYIGGER